MKAVKAWSDIQELLEEEIVTESDLDRIIAEVQGKKKGDLEYGAFKALLDRLDEVAESADSGDDDEAEAVSGNVANNGDDDEEGDDDDDMSEEEVEAMTREVFDELRGKVHYLTVINCVLDHSCA